MNKQKALAHLDAAYNSELSIEHKRDSFKELMIALIEKLWGEEE